MVRGKFTDLVFAQHDQFEKVTKIFLINPFGLKILVGF